MKNKYFIIRVILLHIITLYESIIVQKQNPKKKKDNKNKTKPKTQHNNWTVQYNICGLIFFTHYTCKFGELTESGINTHYTNIIYTWTSIITVPDACGSAKVLAFGAFPISNFKVVVRMVIT